MTPTGFMISVRLLEQSSLFTLIRLRASFVRALSFRGLALRGLAFRGVALRGLGMFM